MSNVFTKRISTKLHKIYRKIILNEKNFHENLTETEKRLWICLIMIRTKSLNIIDQILTMTLGIKLWYDYNIFYVNNTEWLKNFVIKIKIF